MNTQTFKLKLNLTKRQVGSFKVIQVSWKTESDEKHLTSKFLLLCPKNEEMVESKDSFQKYTK